MTKLDDIKKMTLPELHDCRAVYNAYLNAVNFEIEKRFKESQVSSEPQVE